MVSPSPICVIPNWHEVAELCRKPVIEEFRMGTYEISREKDIHHASYEGDFLANSNGFGITPTLAESIDRVPHPFLVFVELLLRRWYPPPPFLHDPFLSTQAGRLQLLSLPPNLLCLRRKTTLPFLQNV